ncbi:hypothetical protein CDL15_Pgr024924 [Punica granatum]|uniref:Uncharacterized protein n=1 Tax=Punica granatum TaxID=22663 RepID=A0A218W779_PUNGR|nr:hypothetical protein CDL15_Pgr024924 [Punica granatum]
MSKMRSHGSVKGENSEIEVDRNEVQKSVLDDVEEKGNVPPALSSSVAAFVPSLPIFSPLQTVTKWEWEHLLQKGGKKIF